MDWIEKNKEELLEMMEQLAHEELSWDDACTLSTLYDAYNALCLVGRMKHPEKAGLGEEPVRPHPRAPQTA